jgi:hypothetical protein
MRPSPATKLQNNIEFKWKMLTHPSPLVMYVSFDAIYVAAVLAMGVAVDAAGAIPIFCKMC